MHKKKGRKMFDPRCSGLGGEGLFGEGEVLFLQGVEELRLNGHGPRVQRLP